MSIKKIKNTLCVILHYGSETDTNKCIESLANDYRMQIIVSDNDPAQNYLPPISFSDKVEIIRTGGKVSFAEGNNIAVQTFLKSHHNFIFILNNDTILTPNAFDLLWQVLADNKIGAVGPCMPFWSEKTKIWSCGGFINKLTLEIGGLQPKKNQPYEVDYLPGAAILCRANVWKMIGGFPEDYFLAYEEAEFALKIKALGLKVLVNPKSIIYHKVGMSSQRKPEYQYNKIRNQIIFAKYLYGKRLGLLWGVICTSKTICAFINYPKFFPISFSLWFRAIIDEFNNDPLNIESLNKIKRLYKSRFS